MTDLPKPVAGAEIVIVPALAVARVLDGRNTLDRKAVEASGTVYLGVGG